MKSVIVCFFAVLAIAYSIFAARVDSPPNGNPRAGPPPNYPVPGYGDLDAEGTAWHGGHGGWGGGGWGGGGWGGGGWGGGGWNGWGR